MKLDWPESIRACSNCWDTWNPGGSQLSWGSNFVATMTSPRRFSLPNLKKKNYYKKPNFWIINWTNTSSSSKFPTNLCRMNFFFDNVLSKKIEENNYLPIKVSPFVLIFSVQMAKFTFFGGKIGILGSRQELPVQIEVAHLFWPQMAQFTLVNVLRGAVEKWGHSIL